MSSWSSPKGWRGGRREGQEVREEGGVGDEVGGEGGGRREDGRGGRGGR